MYKPGHDNLAADALSCLPGPQTGLFSLSDPEVATVLCTWVAIVVPHVSVDDCAREAHQSLVKGRLFAALRYAHCHAMHLDAGAYAKCKHIKHICL